MEFPSDSVQGAEMNIYQTRPLTRWRTIRNVEWRLECKLVDLWVGAFWTQHEMWICLLPCLPLHLKRIRGKCEHKGCKAHGEPVYYDELSYSNEPSLYLCADHLETYCFCRNCGGFYGAQEGGNFLYPGLCDSCGLYREDDSSRYYVNPWDEDEEE